ncbi:unnamed protein product [Medioppia subpectinata]|uniref:non-specific serine/threonine protein kinase n=1 Tax=Medioppia subpectinata TaxID=1979941 RepID=A0A7R9L288_9ACAR|nr:unnamed protein product [Medioppia subpectinata]CAG2113993.1 unnamed protein product [Medioppia subpectinata]
MIRSGGFGTVFKVQHKLDDKMYAIKRVEYGDFSEEKKQRILREVKILLKLDSDFVVKYITSWPESNHLYIQMELCSQSLKTVIKDKAIVFGRQPEDPINVYEYFICCEIFTEILECVQFLHSSDPPVIHRDLKPDNILIEHNFMSSRFIKLCDFGLATDHDMPSMSHTAGAGTSAYMAPEVHQSRYTIKVDIYSLGVIAQHLLDLFNNICPTIGRPVLKFSKIIISGQSIDR